jgi:DNA polymerase
MTLPSGRRLAYPRPRIREGKYGPEVAYEGTDQYTRKWSVIGTYGPKLVENLIQAICRDLLAYGMQRVKEAGHDIILHVHDEAVMDVPMDVKFEDLEKLLALKPLWAEGMPHKAAGFETLFYKKD